MDADHHKYAALLTAMQHLARCAADLDMKLTVSLSGDRREAGPVAPLSEVDKEAIRELTAATLQLVGGTTAAIALPDVAWSIEAQREGDEVALVERSHARARRLAG